MAQWTDSNGYFHNTDSAGYGDQGDLGRANAPANWAAVQAAEKLPSYIDYRTGAGSGEWDRSTNSYYSGDRPFSAAASATYANPAGGNPASTPGVSSMARTDPGKGPANAFSGVQGGASFNPFDPESYSTGWGQTIQGQGLDPYANTPYMNYLGSLAKPMAQNTMLGALGQNSFAGPGDLVAKLQGAMSAPNMGMLQADLGPIAELVKRYYAGGLNMDGSGAQNEGMLAGLIGGWEEDPNSFVQQLASSMGSGLSGASTGIMSYLNRLRGQWNLKQTDQPFAKYFFQNQMGNK